MLWDTILAPIGIHTSFFLLRSYVTNSRTPFTGAAEADAGALEGLTG
ncbi:hypothetical protein GCM10011363_44360 [Marivita lacus]|uniref:Uncharacterized protein n=1 Tax=Marivita lacus TaxID=1323742 RepID=A0ABQ1LCH6_9RHOB|nr:hypothetical protein GCM10011363_44360 [Marivita lacus]